VLTGAVCVAWPGENVIGCRLLRSSCGQRKTIARGLMFRAGWM
jgi:hypothetical protein